MKQQPTVSVIVTTRNNHETIEACLRSIRQQSYRAIDLIVVDNFSTDDTAKIAKRYGARVFSKGPERSAQRNFGAAQARGDYLLIIDSDMELGAEVVQACVEKVTASPGIKAIIIPEESFGEGFWAHCKRLERSFYVGNDDIEAARFFSACVYQQAGGYNELITGGEDWDLTRRVRALTGIGRIDAFIRHNEGRPRFSRTVRKMYYYGLTAHRYFAENPTASAITDHSGPLQRYKLFLSRPATLLRHPLTAAGMFALKTAEYASGGLGYLRGKQALKRKAGEQA